MRRWENLFKYHCLTGYPCPLWRSGSRTGQPGPSAEYFSGRGSGPDQSAVPLSDVNAIAFTQSPGLIGSLLVGAQFAKSLAFSLNIPLIAVHHMQAHVLANLISETGSPKASPDFPFLCLTVSGGHTQIVVCKSPSHMEVIGETLDDAAGEAFDKSAKLLGLPYPGGPLIDRFALDGNASRFKFPEPRIPGLNFSFSGLKTSILYFIQNEKEKDPEFVEKNLADICASIQGRIVSILLNKLKKASAQTGIKNYASPEALRQIKD